MSKRFKTRMGQKQTVGIWISLMLILIAELFCYTWCRVQCVELGYQIAEENERFHHLTTLQKNLRVELARLKSPDRIATIARKQLGLVMPSSRQVIVLNEAY